MQSIKILITTILPAMGFLFSGELYMLYSDTFLEGYYQVGFYFEDAENEEVISDLMDAENENGVAFFFGGNRISFIPLAEKTDMARYGTVLFHSSA